MAEPIVLMNPVGDSLKQCPAVSMNFILEMKVKKNVCFCFLQNLVSSVSLTNLQSTPKASGFKQNYLLLLRKLQVSWEALSQAHTCMCGSHADGLGAG